MFIRGVYFVGVRVVTERERETERKRGETVVERRIVVEVKKKNKKKEAIVQISSVFYIQIRKVFTTRELLILNYILILFFFENK